MAFAGFDWIILAIIGISTLVGFFRGFIRSILSVLVWIGAVVASMVFGPALAQQFSSLTDSPTLQLWLSYGTVFIIAVIVGWILKMIINLMFLGMRMGFFNMMLGALFGFVRGILLVVVLLWFVMLTGLTQNVFFSSGSLTPSFMTFTESIATLFPDATATVQNSMASLKSGVQGLGQGLGGMGGGGITSGSGFLSSGIGGLGGGGLNSGTVSSSIGAVQSVVSQAISAVKTNLGSIGH